MHGDSNFDPATNTNRQYGHGHKTYTRFFVCTTLVDRSIMLHSQFKHHSWLHRVHWRTTDGREQQRAHSMVSLRNRKYKYNQSDYSLFNRNCHEKHSGIFPIFFVLVVIFPYLYLKCICMAILLNSLSVNIFLIYTLNVFS